MTLSVMIPTLNRLASLKLAFQSVIEQSKAVDEIVIADAGSTDGTIEYLNEMRGKISPKLNIVGHPKRVQNWLNGISACKNDHVLILCDDDFIHRRLHENFCQLEVQYNDASLFCFRQQVVNLQSSKPNSYVTNRWKPGHFTGRLAEKQFIQNGFPGFPSIIINKRLMPIDQNSISVFKKADYICDLFLGPQALLKGSVVFDNFVGSTFYYHPNSQSITQGLSLFYPFWDQKIHELYNYNLKILANHFLWRSYKRLFFVLAVSTKNRNSIEFSYVVDNIKIHLTSLHFKAIPKLMIKVMQTKISYHSMALLYQLRNKL